MVERREKLVCFFREDKSWVMKEVWVVKVWEFEVGRGGRKCVKFCRRKGDCFRSFG